MTFEVSKNFSSSKELKGIFKKKFDSLPRWAKEDKLSRVNIVIGTSSEDVERTSGHVLNKSIGTIKIVLVSNYHEAAVRLLASFVRKVVLHKNSKYKWAFRDKIKTITDSSMSDQEVNDILATFFSHFVLYFSDRQNLRNSLPERYSLCREVSVALEAVYDSKNKNKVIVQ